MPPFRSTKQRGYLYANEPEIAKKFESKTPKGAKLPKGAPKRTMKKSGRGS